MNQDQLSSIIQSPCFPSQIELINELIMQHFSGNEIVKLSEVSPDMHNYIFSRKDQTAKIRLVIDQRVGSKRKPEGINYEFTNIMRPYQHICVKQHYNRFAALIPNLSESLVTICSKCDMKLDGMTLPSITSLRLGICCSCHGKYYKNGLLEAVINLQELRIYARNSEGPLKSKIVRCLKANKQLTKLSLERGVAAGLLDNSTSIFTFRIKFFELDARNFSEADESKFIEFLNSQAASLRELKITNCPFHFFEKILNVLPNLQQLSYKALHELLPLNISTYPNIVDLTLINVREKIIRRWLPKLPNITKLCIDGLTKKTFEFITAKFTKIQEFSFDENCYKKLKKIQNVNHVAIKQTSTSHCNCYQTCYLVADRN